MQLDNIDKKELNDWPGVPEDDSDKENDEGEEGDTSDLPGVISPVEEKKNGTPFLSLKEIKESSAQELMPCFKDVRNVWRTASLFQETCDDPRKYPPIFSLKDEDTSSCVSLKKLYLLIEDVTEHKFAELCLGGWEHWEAINDSWILKPHIEKWRSLLDLKLKSKYLEKIKQIAEESEGPVALTATKYLLEETTGFKDKASSSKRGRPSKLEKEAAIKREIKDSTTIRQDAERLGLKVV